MFVTFGYIRPECPDEQRPAKSSWSKDLEWRIIHQTVVCISKELILPNTVKGSKEHSERVLRESRTAKGSI